MDKIKVGDLVRIKPLVWTMSGTDTMFRMYNKSTNDNIQYAQREELKGKIGIVLSENASDEFAHRSMYSEVYRVAFNDIVAQAFKDYFHKVEKNLNKAIN
jgi:hypothetical protein